MKVEYLKVRTDAIVVSLKEHTSLNEKYKISKNMLAKVYIGGERDHIEKKWVIRLDGIGDYNDEPYFLSTNEFFREGTPEELAYFEEHLKEGESTVFLPCFKAGQRVKINKERVYTTNYSHTLKDEYEGIIEDCIINNDPSKSILWFSDHSDVFRVSDFDLVEGALENIKVEEDEKAAEELEKQRQIELENAKEEESI